MALDYKAQRDAALELADQATATAEVLAEALAVCHTALAAFVASEDR